MAGRTPCSPGSRDDEDPDLGPMARADTPGYVGGDYTANPSRGISARHIWYNYH